MTSLSALRKIFHYAALAYIKCKAYRWNDRDRLNEDMFWLCALRRDVARHSSDLRRENKSVAIAICITHVTIDYLFIH